MISHPPLWDKLQTPAPNWQSVSRQAQQHVIVVADNEQSPNLMNGKSSAIYPGRLIKSAAYRKTLGGTIMGCYDNFCLFKWSMISVITGQDWCPREEGSQNDISALLWLNGTAVGDMSH